MSELAIAGYVPGAIGRVTELHAAYYGAAWDFGLYFEAKVAAELSQFLQRLDPVRDGFWTAVRDGRVEGSIAVDGAGAQTEGAHLRWFILSDALRAQGVGNRLLREAVEFCRQCGYARVFLWTFRGLEPARHLPKNSGFAWSSRSKASNGENACWNSATCSTSAERKPGVCSAPTRRSCSAAVR